MERGPWMLFRVRAQHTLDQDVKKRVCEVKGDDVILWDSITRHRNGSRGHVIHECRPGTPHPASRARTGGLPPDLGRELAPAVAGAAHGGVAALAGQHAGVGLNDQQRKHQDADRRGPAQTEIDDVLLARLPWGAVGGYRTCTSLLAGADVPRSQRNGSTPADQRVHHRPPRRRADP